MKKLFPWLVAISAISVSASAAFYSVSGLSKLFAGASLAVIIMASSLEVAKLVIASLLYQFWNGLNKVLRTYLTLSVVILMAITSLGIYGFLSSAYQETASKLLVNQNERKFIEQKIDLFSKDVFRYDKELEVINNNIALLNQKGTDQIQVRDTSSSTGYRTTISTRGLKVAQERLKIEDKNKTTIQLKRQLIQDTIQKLQLKMLDIDNSDFSGELGPLIYLSNVTGISMDKIINILLIIIVFVFDPLAVSLVIGANYAFEKQYVKKKITETPIESFINFEKKYDAVNDAVNEDINEDVLKTYEEIIVEKHKKETQEINDMEVEYEEVKVPIYDKDKLQWERYLNLKKELERDDISGWKKNKIKREIDGLNLKNNDLNKTY